MKLLPSLALLALAELAVARGEDGGAVLPDVCSAVPESCRAIEATGRKSCSALICEYRPLLLYSNQLLIISSITEHTIYHMPEGQVNLDSDANIYSSASCRNLDNHTQHNYLDSPRNYYSTLNVSGAYSRVG